MITESRYASLVWMAESTPPEAFFTNHARVLICIAHDPGIRLRDIGERLGITERAAHRIVDSLAAAGYITRQRNGRRNYYTIDAEAPLPDAIARERSIGELLEILTARTTPRSSTSTDQVGPGNAKTPAVAGASRNRGARI